MLRWGNTGVTEWAVFARYPALVSERNKTRNRASILEFRRTRRFDLLWGAWSLILSLNQRVLGSNPSASTIFPSFEPSISFVTEEVFCAMHMEIVQALAVRDGWGA